MNKKLSILSFLLFVTFLSIGQIENENGKVISRDGQTYAGKIIYYYDDPNSIIVTDTIGEQMIFEPSKIDRIDLDLGRRFVSLLFRDKSGSSNLILQSVIESDKISFYQLNKINSISFFVSKNDTLYKLENNMSIITLDSKEHRPYIDDRRVRRYDYQYVGILRYLMKDRPEFMDRIGKTELRFKSLSQLIREYNNYQLSYYWDNKSKKKAKWLAYTQFSHHGVFWSNKTVSTSLGISIGLQHYLNQNGRGYFRYAINYSNIHIYEYDYTFYDLEFWYNFNFVKTRDLNWYGTIHIIDIGYYETTEIETEIEDTHFSLIPRFSLGAGVEYKPTKRLSMFAELNNLLAVKYIPSSFSFGLIYSLN